MDLNNLLLERDKAKDGVKELEQKLEKKRKELAELNTAIKVMNKYSSSHEPYLDFDFPEKSEKTIMEIILEILSEYDGLTSNELLRKIRNNYMPKLERTSMSPQLSRLKKRRKLEHKKGKWWKIKNEFI